MSPPLMTSPYLWPQVQRVNFFPCILLLAIWFLILLLDKVYFTSLEDFVKTLSTFGLEISLPVLKNSLPLDLAQEVQEKCEVVSSKMERWRIPHLDQLYLPLVLLFRSSFRLIIIICWSYNSTSLITSSNSFSCKFFREILLNDNNRSMSAT